MSLMGCFSCTLIAGGRRKKLMIADAKKASGNECPKAKPVDDVDKCGDKVAPFDVGIDPDMVLVVSVKGGDMAPVKSDSLSDFDFDFHARDKPVVAVAEKGATGVAPDAGIASGAEEDKAARFVSDQMVAEAQTSPMLKRSCSNIETKRSGPRDGPNVLARSRSYGDIPLDTIPHGAPLPSPASVRTSRTADRVLLKKRSSSQVLPSRSRKLWWRLFLWSHRNLHQPRSARPTAAGTPRSRCGYTSDTLEEDAADLKNRKAREDSLSPAMLDQWVAFSADNCVSERVSERVSAWVNNNENEPFRITTEEDDQNKEHSGWALPPRPHDVGESSGKGHGGKSKRCAAADEVTQANAIIQSLNSVSSVAHISGMGLRVVPMIASFSSLRSVNLSGNFIVHISPASLPKGLHSLDLSRNKIANIEGLRDLTRLRALNLSYNRISRIGHGLSNCTAIKELYLAGNKISDVEGLHRLLKLVVLDLGFNKINTAKALGQLVANYHSLLAINLVGNPVQVNLGDDALRKVVMGLAPQLAYLNKQPVKPKRAREVATDSVARAALGGSGRRGFRKPSARRLSQSPGSSSSGRSRGGEGMVRSRSNSEGTGRTRPNGEGIARSRSNDEVTAKK